MNTTPNEGEVKSASEHLQTLLECLNGAIFGQNALMENLVVGLVARGHILLEGLPGLGKTETVKALARAVQLDVKRIQFTPDLLPGDITGSPILEETPQGRRFVFQPGPVFTNLLLADEINRASPKTQSALLEAMQERRVTVMGESRPLPDPFFVLATQNPIELEGTYPLPEAQLDRFLFKLEVKSGSREVLERIVNLREMGVEPEVRQVLSRESLRAIQELARQIYLPPVVANYIARLVYATHPGHSRAANGVKFGASPRAALGLAAAGRARALINGRINASFEDIRAVSAAILQHRIILDYTSRLQGRGSAGVVQDLLEEVPYQDREAPPVLQDTSRVLQ